MAFQPATSNALMEAEHVEQSGDRYTSLSSVHPALHALHPPPLPRTRAQQGNADRPVDQLRYSLFCPCLHSRSVPPPHTLTRM
jgi:hypothetical protein